MKQAYYILLIFILCLTPLFSNAIIRYTDWVYQVSPETCFEQISLVNSCVASNGNIDLGFTFKDEPPCKTVCKTAKTVDIMNAFLYRYKINPQGGPGTNPAVDQAFNILSSFPSTSITNALTANVCFTCPNININNYLGGGDVEDFQFTICLGVYAHHQCPGGDCMCNPGIHTKSRKVEIQFWSGTSCNRTVSYTITYSHEPNPDAYKCDIYATGTLSSASEGSFSNTVDYSNALNGSTSATESLTEQDVAEFDVNWGDTQEDPGEGDPTTIQIEEEYPFVDEFHYAGAGSISDTFGTVESGQTDIDLTHSTTSLYWQWVEFFSVWIKCMNCDLEE